MKKETITSLDRKLSKILNSNLGAITKQQKINELARKRQLLLKKK